jgi:hypothetical protein
MSCRISRSVAVMMIACASLTMSTRAEAQTASTEQMAFDRPEAWAMKYFTSATALDGLGTPERPRRGSLALQFEMGWLPTLSAAQERVGFNGSTPEDLNKAPVFLRPRLAVGLSHQLSFIVAFDPPIRSFGVTPRLLALGLEGVVHDGGTWSVGWRAHGQTGTVTAAVSCPANVLSFAPGSASNPAGCTAESSDVTTLRYAGAEILFSQRVGRRLVPHESVGANVVDGIFQTNAQTFGQPDYTRLQTHGVTAATSVGVGYRVTGRLEIVADLFYAPLTVRRLPSAAHTIDPMFNARALISYRVAR